MTYVDQGRAPDEVERPDPPRAGAGLRDRAGWSSWTVVMVLVVGLVVTGVLTWLSAELYTHNEKRLLRLRAGDVATVLTGALPSIETPLASAVAVADASNGNAAEFKRLAAIYVGSHTFDSVSLWRTNDPARGPVAVVGSTPRLVPTSVKTSQLFRHASNSPNVSVIGLLKGPHPDLGYAFTGMGGGAFAVYGESALPRNRYTPVQTNSAFDDLNFALYLGASTKPADLLVASVRRLPLRGDSATVKVPFGDTSFTVKVTARSPLASSVTQQLPWVIAVVGTVLTLGAIALTLRLIQRGRDAERLAAQLEELAEENRRLYDEQRGIAQTLQHALLPGNLPQFPGLQVSARYEAGVEGVDVGGDWYDFLRLDDRRLLLVVGDVSGRGLPAATAMAVLRFAIQAYAMQGDAPPTFLPKLSRLVSVVDDRLLATVLCALIDRPTREVSITSAGHLPPLMISTSGSEFVATEVGLPVGIDRDASYSSTTTTVPKGGTLLAFTDGLVERRGESIEVGLERLRSQVSPNHDPLDQMLTEVLRELRREPSDDTAIAGVRWVT